MKTEELMERIRLPKEARELARTDRIGGEEYEVWKGKFYHDIRQFIEEWEEICRETGYSSTETKEIYGELPAPETDTFPFENEIMQWMGEYLCVSEKQA